MLNDYIPLVVLVLGGGVGITGVTTFFRLGKKDQSLEDRSKELKELATKFENRAAVDELVRTLDRDVKSLKDSAGELARARMAERDHTAHEREELARKEERLDARLKAVEKDLEKVLRGFSKTFPRVQLTSSPDLSEIDKEKSR
jgi:hypothetical protein